MVNFDEIFRALSSDRLIKYQYNPAADIKYTGEQVIQRYLFNMDISVEFSKAIHILEVVLRNSLVESWNGFLGTDDWPSNSQGIPTSRKYREMHRVLDKAKKYAGPSSGNGKIIAELSLGFWVHLLDKKFEKTNFKIIKNIFPSKKKWDKNLSKSISNLHERISVIQELRNRVAHHEPIFHYKDLKDKYKEILKLIGIINPSCHYLVRANDFYQKIDKGWQGVDVPSQAGE